MSGSGSLADGVQTPSVDDPTGDPTADPTDDSGGGSGGGGSTDSPEPTATDDGGSGGSGGSGGGGGSAPAGSACAVLKPSELQAIFGEPVTVQPSGSRDCDFKTANGGASVSIYDYLDLTEEKQSDPGGKDLTIAGQPAYQVEERRISIARTKDPSAPGMIVAYNTYYTEPSVGLPKLIALLEKIVPAFPK